jgi:hypothetical protein
VIDEVTGWQGHSPEEVKAMTDRLAHLRAEQQARIAQIPSEAALGQVQARADEVAREWAPDAEYLGCRLLMIIRGRDVSIFSKMAYRSEARRGAYG